MLWRGFAAPQHLFLPPKSFVIPSQKGEEPHKTSDNFVVSKIIPTFASLKTKKTT